MTLLYFIGSSAGSGTILKWTKEEVHSIGRDEDENWTVMTKNKEHFTLLDLIVVDTQSDSVGLEEMDIKNLGDLNFLL